jgi:multiple sugar transport system permease protein
VQPDRRYPVLGWYTATLTRYVLVALVLGGLMWLTHRVLIRLGMRQEAATGLAFISPWLIGALVWNVYPIFASLYFSFTDYNILQPPTWVGLENYRRVFTQDTLFWPSFRLTMVYAFISVPLGLAGAVAAGLLLNQKVRAVGLWRTLFYMPAVLPAFIVALLWRLLLMPTRSGLINMATEPIWSRFMDGPPRWFLDPDMVLWSFVLMSLWGVFGANTIIVLAGLKNISRELYEAAEVDGAGVWARFRYITLPQLSPTMFYLLVIGAIGAVQIFDQPMFVELPPGAANFLNVLVYQQAFAFSNMGYGSALAWIMFVVILVLTLLIFRSSEAWVYYEKEAK